MELKGKCLDWLGKHFTRIWPTKAFASLTKELMNECYINTVAQITPENVIDTILACDRLSTSLPRIKWAETIFELITKLQKDSSAFVTNHYDVVVDSKSFTGLGRGRDWNIHAVEETFILAISDIEPDTACKSLMHLSKYADLAADTETGFGHGPYSEAFVSLLKKLIKYTERQIVHFGSRATSCPTWDTLPINVQNRIHDSSLLLYEFEKPIKPMRIPASKDGDEKVANRQVRSVAASNNKTSRPSSANNSRSDESAPVVQKQVTKVASDHKSRTKSPSHRRKGDVRELVKSASGASSSSASSVTTSASSARPITSPGTGASIKSEPIYDEVPDEKSVAKENASAAPNTSTRIPAPAASVGSASKKSQVAKVSPFNLKTNTRTENQNRTEATSSAKSVTSQDLMAEIDADSSLVHHCLQEAEALEAELTRKLKHYQANFCKDMPSRQSTSSNRRKVSLPVEIRNPIPAFIGPHVPRTRTGLVPTSPIRKPSAGPAAKPVSRTTNRPSVK
jgi:hypothetical protein